MEPPGIKEISDDILSLYHNNRVSALTIFNLYNHLMFSINGNFLMPSVKVNFAYVHAISIEIFNSLHTHYYDRRSKIHSISLIIRLKNILLNVESTKKEA